MRGISNIRLLIAGVMVWITGVSEARSQARSVRIELAADAAPRVQFGADRLGEALKRVGYTVTVGQAARRRRSEQDSAGRPILIRTLADVTPLERLSEEGGLKPGKHLRSKEGFMLAAEQGGRLIVAGGGDSGTLYGCLELARRVEESGELPKRIQFADSPAFKLRGPCIGMQLTSILPDRGTYEYPYTPENFPWFYDKKTWLEYLDVLVEKRMNTLYLWNGHPFASLVRLDDYPYAIEVSDEEYRQNVEIFRFLTEEADKRGIWVIQMFYNIFVSKPFAEHHKIATQHAAPTDLIADYNRKSIAKFVEQYPNVGLLVCLGEALSGTPNKISWMNETIIPGVKLGMKRLGETEEPPIVVRAHTLGRNVRDVMESSLQHYSNLYTMAKYNGESLTTYVPRGDWQLVHLDMGLLGSTHVVNVHLLSNLEPFRYGATDFIRKSVLACRDRLGAQGVHLYPLAYWDWPNAPDKVDPYLKQYERDWIWFEAWGRYSWDPDRDPAAENQYWVKRLAARYGNEQAARLILEAYQASGQCAPMLLRRFGITEGNRQTFSLGMLLEQLVNPGPWRPYSGLWEDQAPPGERLQEFATREWSSQPHVGETPVSVIEDVLGFSQKAVDAIEMARPLVSGDSEEFERLRNDIHCIQLISQYYAEKVRGAILMLRFEYSSDKDDVRAVLPHLEKSFEIYKQLADRTRDTYRYSQTLQTGHRRVPVRGMRGREPWYYHWDHMLPVYEEELTDFRNRVANLDSEAIDERSEPGPTLEGVPFELLSEHAETYEVRTGAQPFADRTYRMLQLAEELQGLTGVRFSHEAGKKGELAPIRFRTKVPVKILIGYFDEERAIWAQPPNLDTHSQAALHGGIESTMLNITTLEGCPAVNLHVFTFDKGEITFDPRGPGSYLILGIVAADAEIKTRDVGRSPGRR